MQKSISQVLLALGLSLSIALSQPGVSWSCQVPVFRYALERWAPEKYKISVFTEEESKKPSVQGIDIESLFQQISTNGNWTVEYKSSRERDSNVKTRLPASVQQDAKLSRTNKILIEYPGASDRPVQGIAAEFPIDETVVRQIGNSPVCERIAADLLNGNAVVWVLLESGNPKLDAKARKELELEIARSKEKLTLPTAEELNVTDELLTQVKIPWKIDFSIISVDRKDPKEQVLIQTLLSSEEDLKEFDEPILFPVFGRGIVLYALVGEGIEQSLIREAIAFVMGPCSCQVKEQNPGFDLLLNVDWDSKVGNKFISQPAPEQDTAPRILKIPPGTKRQSTSE